MRFSLSEQGERDTPSHSFSRTNKEAPIWGDGSALICALLVARALSGSGQLGRKGLWSLTLKSVWMWCEERALPFQSPERKFWSFLLQRTISHQNVSMIERHPRVHLAPCASQAHKHFCIFHGNH